MTEFEVVILAHFHETIPGTTHFDESERPAYFCVKNNSPPQN